MKNPILYLFALLGLWIGGGAWVYYNSTCCAGIAYRSHHQPFNHTRSGQ